jgi:hypothetical protein
VADPIGLGIFLDHLGNCLLVPQTFPDFDWGTIFPVFILAALLLGPDINLCGLQQVDFFVAGELLPEIAQVRLALQPDQINNNLDQPNIIAQRKQQILIRSSELKLYTMMHFIVFHNFFLNGI